MRHEGYGGRRPHRAPDRRRVRAVPPRFEVPPGKIATVVTYLELRERPPRRQVVEPSGLALRPIGADLARYRELFRCVGEPWLWFSRARLGDAALRSILEDPGVEAYALTDGEDDIGLLELDFRPQPEAELAFFGVRPDRVGRGAGRHLMERALDLAFARPIERLFVHTCTIDHPDALPFYLRSGFRPYRRMVEIGDDPRLAGTLPRTAAPHHPLLQR